MNPTPDPALTLDALRAVRAPTRPQEPASGPYAQRAARQALEAARRGGVAAEGRRVTSRAAAMRVMPKAGTQRWQVLEAIAKGWAAGQHGATDPEVMARTGLHANSARPRRVELVQAGLVYESAVSRVHEGSAHIVWAPAPAVLLVLGYRPDGG